MYLVKAHSITHVPDGTNDYVFPCRQPTSLFQEVPGYLYLDTMEKSDVSDYLKNISEVQRETYMWELFQSRVIPKIELNEPIGLNGTFTKQIYNYFRKFYEEKGYYIPWENRYLIPETTTITLGIDLANLVYQSHRKPSAYLSQWAIRSNIAALNDGLIARIYVRPTDMEDITLYLQQSHLQLQRLAPALYQGWRESNPDSLREFMLRALPPSWNEVPSE